jgi:hypothetical protein
MCGLFQGHVDTNGQWIDIGGHVYLFIRTIMRIYQIEIERKSMKEINFKCNMLIIYLLYIP